MTVHRHRDQWTWKRFGVYLAMLVTAIVILAVLLDQVVLPMIVSSTRTIIVPNMVGLSEDDARKRLTDLGLVVMDPHEQVSETHAEGTVIQQSPYSGATVKEGRRIYLTVSAGKETVLMPDVRRMSLREARLNLMRLGLAVGNLAQVPSDSVAPDRVVDQSRAPGDRVPAGSRIDLAISQGPSGVRVPDLLGYSLTDANTILTDIGLVVGKIERIASGAMEPNTVLATVPPADSLVPPGSAIGLRVTK